jgi:WD40 repeat protein
VYLYDAQTGAEVRLLETRAQVGSCAFSPDGRTLAAVVNSDILLWRVAGGLIEHTVHGTFTAFSQISYSAAGSLQVAWWSHEAQGLFLWRDGVQTSLPEARGSPDSPESSPADLAFSPDGRLLAAGTSEGMLYLLQVSDGAAVAVAPAQTSRVSGVAFSPHGQVLAIVSGDGTVRL